MSGESVTWMTPVRLKDLQAGDKATFLLAGRPYEGPVYQDARGLCWGEYVALHGEPTSWAEKNFVSATRVNLKPPHRVGSLIVDVRMASGTEYEQAVLISNDGTWLAVSGDRVGHYVANDIVDWKPGKAVQT